MNGEDDIRISFDGDISFRRSNPNDLDSGWLPVQLCLVQLPIFRAKFVYTRGEIIAYWSSSSSAVFMINHLLFFVLKEPLPKEKTKTKSLYSNNTYQ
mmetsp:Transcript_10192/g.24507  ORF Transcript_10192/g.24507 Transcript_10192/m.24507 type:complete len:97 (-) Transcript_10192:407-697(-)